MNLPWYLCHLVYGAGVDIVGGGNSSYFVTNCIATTIGGIDTCTIHH